MPLIPDSQSITDGTTAITLMYRNALNKDGVFYGAQRTGESASLAIEMTTKHDVANKTVARRLVSLKFTRVTSGVARQNTINLTAVGPRDGVDAELEQDIAYAKSLYAVSGFPANLADDFA